MGGHTLLGIPNAKQERIASPPGIYFGKVPVPPEI